MFKFILAMVVVSLTACGGSGKSSSDKEQQVSQIETNSASDFDFILDENLRNCLEDLGVTPDTVHTVDCSGKRVQSLSGISQLPKLKNLNVSYNQITDLEPLQEAKGLQVLYAINNQIASVDPLDSLPELKEVSLRANDLTDVSAFYTMPSLKKLYIQDNKDLSIDSNQLNDNAIVAI